MSLRLLALRQYELDGEVIDLDLSDPATLLLGPRNSSKTTTLRMIDFCFGHDDSAQRVLGPEIADTYLGIDLEVQLQGETHLLRRAFDPAFGLRTKVNVDGADMDPGEASGWLMDQLGWPTLAIPRGRVAESATALVPLTFRTLLRHIYRREGSWLEFASQEEEFHRQAVLAFFLGIAERRYSNEAYRLGEARRRITELRGEVRALEAVSDETVERMARELALPRTALREVDEREAELGRQSTELGTRRQVLTKQMRATHGFATEAARQFEDVARELAGLRTARVELSDATTGYRAARQTNMAQGARLERASTAVEMLASLPVTMCPVCGQEPPRRPGDAAATGHCYLCSQEVAADIRQRRIALEQQVLARELTELDEVIVRTEREIAELDTQIAGLVRRQEDLGRRLDEERQELVSPFLAELQQIDRELGGIEQKRAALSGLAILNERAEALNGELTRLEETAESLDATARRAQSQRAETHRRAQRFADRMNDFLYTLGVESWHFGRVSIEAEDLSFFVGGDTWDVTLGGESKVVFLLAYHYALLHLDEDLPDISRSPGLAILDNPLQHGLSSDVVGECLDKLVEAAGRLHAQVVVTLPRRVPLSVPVKSHIFTIQYGIEGTE